jgi:predicted RNA binding protein YcfA (HicA-like mRNA interferase family)
MHVRLPQGEDVSGKGKDIGDLLRQARRAGLSVERTNGGHWKVRCPKTNRLVTVSHSPRSVHGVRAAKRDIDSLIQEMAS